MSVKGLEEGNKIRNLLTTLKKFTQITKINVTP